MHQPSGCTPFPSAGAGSAGSPADALARAVDLAALAASVHGAGPWELERCPDRLLLRADRTRRPTAGRDLVRGAGAALFTARVALAGAGRAAAVDRLPDPGDPDLLAVVRPVPGAPDAALAVLAPTALCRRTAGWALADDDVPDVVLRRLTASAAEEGALLVPVRTEAHRRLVARLTRQAGGVPGAGPTLVLVATRADDPRAWLRSGEAMQRVLLELAVRGWGAEMLTRAVEVPLTRTQLRSALSWDAHPQLLLHIGRAAPAPARACDEVAAGRAG